MTNPCRFEIEVLGTLNVDENFDNKNLSLVWSGGGTVTVAGNYKNSNKGCTGCGSMSCPNFNIYRADCKNENAECTNNFSGQLKECGSAAAPPLVSNCPDADIIVESIDPSGAVVDWIEPTASTPCGVVPLISAYRPGDRFPIGTTVVEYRAVNERTDTMYCTVNVKVMAPKLEIDFGSV